MMSFIDSSLAFCKLWGTIEGGVVPGQYETVKWLVLKMYQITQTHMK